MSGKTHILGHNSVHIVASVLWHHIVLQVANDPCPIFMVEASKVSVCSGYVVGMVTLLDHSEHDLGGGGASSTL
jgi:hypothetical protein